MPPQVYKAISDAIQSCQLNGQDPAQDGRGRRLATRSMRSSQGYKGALRSSESNVEN